MSAPQSNERPADLPAPCPFCETPGRVLHCPDCNGSGTDPDDGDLLACPKCSGTGLVLAPSSPQSAPAAQFREGMSFDEWWNARAFEFGYDSIKAAHQAAREAWMACIALAPEEASGAVPDPKGGARAEILKALKNYRCSKTVDGDGDGMPLLDLLSPGETVAEGLEELRNLAEYLDDKLADCLAPPAQAGASPNDLVTTVHEILGHGSDEVRWPPGMEDHEALRRYVASLAGAAPNGVREALAKLVAHLDACIPHSRVKEIDVSTELMNLMEAAGTALSTPTGDTDQAPASDDEKETAAIAAGYARCLRALLDGLGGVWVTRAMANASNPEYFLSLGREIAGRLGPAPVVTEPHPPDDTDLQFRKVRALLIDARWMAWSRHPGTAFILSALKTMLPNGVHASDATALNAVRDADLTVQPATPVVTERPSFEVNIEGASVRAYGFLGRVDDAPGLLRRAAESAEAVIKYGLIQADLNQPNQESK